MKREIKNLGLGYSEKAIQKCSLSHVIARRFLEEIEFLEESLKRRRQILSGSSIFFELLLFLCVFLGNVISKFSFSDFRFSFFDFLIFVLNISIL